MVYIYKISLACAVPAFVLLLAWAIPAIIAAVKGIRAVGAVQGSLPLRLLLLLLAAICILFAVEFSEKIIKSRFANST